MGKACKQGVMVGIFAPLIFLAALVGWVYRYTKKVPFPINRPAEGELVIKLVDPQEVPILWRQWKVDLEPLWAAWRALGQELKERWGGR